MEQKHVYEYVGDLNRELLEFKKVVSDKESVENSFSTTAKCGTLLTLYCC